MVRRLRRLLVGLAGLRLSETAVRLLIMVPASSSSLRASCCNSHSLAIAAALRQAGIWFRRFGSGAFLFIFAIEKRPEEINQAKRDVPPVRRALWRDAREEDRRLVAQFRPSFRTVP